MLGDFKRYYRAMRFKMAAGEMNDDTQEAAAPVPVPQAASQVRAELSKAFNGSSDFRLLSFGNETVLMAYLDGMVDKLLVSQSVIEPLKAGLEELTSKPSVQNRAKYLSSRINAMCASNTLTDFDDCVEGILAGGTLIFIDGEASGIYLDLRRFEKRAVEESKSEAVIRGSRQAFTEVLSTNLTMLRRIIHDSCLVFESFEIGRQTKTKVIMSYMKGVVNQEILDEVRKRLRNIKTDVILESGYIEEFIEDSPFSVFPTVFNSERPDSVAAKLLEGRVAILCDGTPVVLTVPSLFIDNMQFTEDYSKRWISSVIIRPVRFLAFLVATTLPAFYIALVCFHQDIVPFKLLITISNSLADIPFPPLLEMLALTFLFELITESGLRMPSTLGQAVSIVGALIVGQAAVQAGLFSTAGVIIVAATSISAFITPKLDISIFIIRVCLMFAANSLGILGILLAGTAFFAYACSLRSFTVPYLSPITPHFGSDMKDVFVRIPLWAMFSKPESITKRYVRPNK